MKHRSLIIFVIIVAALVVVPEAAQQLVEFKRTAVERASRGVSNAFLNLYAQRLRGQETRGNAALSSSTEAKELRAATCALADAAAANAAARRASFVREKSPTGRENSRQRRLSATESAPDVLMAKNRLKLSESPLNLHLDMSMLPEISTRMAVQDMPKVASVRGEFISADVVRALKRLEMRDAAAPSPAPEWSRAERDAASKPARLAARNARTDERRREVRLRMLEPHGDAPRGPSVPHSPQVKGYKWKAHGAPPAPPANAPEAMPPAGATSVETLIGF